ncbi:MAG: sigma-54-dependent Fis family transcriptional regulator [Sulfuritalea sp.]|nr:sigma-54-dependent Fis family transcriptional regulator [Sulfuritalea sp.]
MANAATISDVKAIIAAKDAFVSRGMIDERVAPPGVYRSWERCLSSRLRQDHAVEFLPVQRSDLAHLRDTNRQLLDVSNTYLERLASAVCGAGYVVLLTDNRGYALNVVGALDRRDGPMWHAHRHGVNLSEPVIGTTAMACAMAERRAMNVFGHQHFFEGNHIFQCSAAPIIDPLGNVIGAVDVTRTSHTPNPGSLMLVKQCAREIEAELFRRTPSFLSVRLCWQASGEVTGDSLLLAFGSDGQVIAMSENARTFLNCPREAGILSFEDLFDDQFGTFVNRVNGANGAVALRIHSGLALYATPAPRREQHAPKGDHCCASVIGGSASIEPTSEVEFGDRGVGVQLAAAINATKIGLPILVLGETGSGKEVVANVLHAATVGDQGSLIAINCAAIPESLIESELFGYVEGAFTGSKRGGAPGKIELANGGTLFLDEIGDMPLSLQARLLRVLETKTLSRLGSGTTRKVNFQLICATHQNIELAVREGRFRRDLYYRINGAVVRLPPLRERSGIKELARGLLDDITQGTRSLSEAAEALLCKHTWPGNVRELRHALTYAHAMAPEGEPLRPEDFRLDIQSPLEDKQRNGTIGNRPGSLAALEKEAVTNALLSTDGHVGRAAAILGISRATLYRWLRQSPMSTINSSGTTAT